MRADHSNNNKTKLNRRLCGALLVINPDTLSYHQLLKTNTIIIVNYTVIYAIFHFSSVQAVTPFELSGYSNNMKM
jgi:hypothetical protein